MKKVWKMVVAVLIAVFCLVVSYVLYVLMNTDRIADSLELEVRGGGQTQLEPGTVCTAVTYNLGFGAYLPDYSFFMDGGTESRCASAESAADTIRGAAALALEQQPQLVLLQEVDTYATRSWHVDQLALVDEAFSGYDRVFACNYHSAYLFYPFHQPIGASNSGIVTLSSFPVQSALRRSLPVENGLGQLLDLDRCYSISRIPISDGRELAVFNVHLSAYSNDEAVLEGQIRMLMGDLEKEVQAGNPVLCGGDFNHDLRKTDDSGEAYSWTHYFPRESLPEGVHFAYDLLSSEAQAAQADSCRAASEAYDPETAFTVLLDGFLLSDDLELLEYETVFTGYRFSDHDPVRLTFRLR